jgi:hypothetical protein
MTSDPFNLPNGSIRALLTVLLVTISAIVLFVPSVNGSDDVRAMFVLLTGIAVRDYFAHRAETNRRETARSTGTITHDTASGTA